MKMIQNDPLPIYYFIVINLITQTEIGNILYHHNGTIDDFNAIIQIKNSITKTLVPHKRTTLTRYLTNHIVFGNSFDGKAFYLVAIKRRNWFTVYWRIFVALVIEIEHQGIKQMTTSSGELSEIGMKNLTYSIETFKENYIENRAKAFDVKFYLKAIVNCVKGHKEVMIRYVKKLLKGPTVKDTSEFRRGERLKLIRKVSFWVFAVFFLILHIIHTKILFQKAKENNK